MRYARLCLPIAIALAAGACHDSEARPPFPSTPYEGRVDVRIAPPGGGGHDERGRATARFSPDGSSPTALSVIGAISDPRGDTGLQLEGGPTRDGGWQGHMGEVRVAIDRTGRITGGGTMHPQSFTVTGQVSPTDFDLVVTVELLEPNAGGLPQGTRMHFTYDLEQRTQSRAQTPRRKRRASLDDCRNVGYEVRPVPDPAGGTLVMRRMPVCGD